MRQSAAVKCIKRSWLRSRLGLVRRKAQRALKKETLTACEVS